MDGVCRVLFALQQKYFLWLRATAEQNVGDPAISIFLDDIEEKVLSYQVGALAPLPALWYSDQS